MKYNSKGAAIALSLMVLSAGTMAAVYGGGTKKDLSQTKNQMIQLEERELAESREKPEDTQEKQNDPELESDFLKSEPEEVQEEEHTEEAASRLVISENFLSGAEPSLQWPVQGEVILDYSMDQSIYFPTLAQFQYNPAMILGAQQGTSVLAAAAGIVTEVGTNDAYGQFVKMDIGNGYEVTYGQLSEITAELGDQVEVGTPFAIVAAPGGAYVEEGENIYFQVTENGVPIDPKLLLNQE